MKKRLTALAMALVLCLSFLVIPAAAAEATVGGTYSAGVVTVTGTGFVENLKYSVIAVMDGSGSLVAMGAATANGGGELSATITTGKIADVTGYKVYVYNDNGGTIAAQGSVTLPAATMPSASFEASTMILTISNFESSMTYSVDGGATWTAAAASVDLSAANVTTANGVKVKNATAGAADAIRTIALTQQSAPAGVGKTDETAENASDGTITGVTTAMEYKTSTATGWTAITGASVTGLTPGAYQIRAKGAGTALPSNPVTVTIAAYGAPPITQTYTIAFNANGGAVTPASGATGVDGRLASLPTPTRSSYTFDGWFTLASGGNQVTVSTVFSADGTIYAHWTSSGGTSGGGGGGNSGGGGGSTSGNGSVSGSGNNVSVNTGSGGSVSESTLKSAADKATSGSTISVNAGGSNSASLSISGMTALADNNNGVSLTLKNGAITLSADAIKDLVEGRTSGNVAISIQPRTSSTDNAVKALLDAGAKVFDVSMAMGSTTIHSFDGSMAITLTVSGLGSMKKPVVVHVMDNGDQETYTPTISGNKITITGVRSLSSFAVMEAADVPESKPGVSFTDVSSDAYYAGAVAWAVEKGITSGTTATTFSPNAGCTRAQVVTFLWRANGSPAATSGSSFADVSGGAYYAQAVAWAVEKGITDGTTAATFSPDATCTRAQVVTFLHRAEGSPAASGAGFSDVDSGAYYAGAVAWAVQNGVTSGTTAETFSPNTTCTRAQVVTFLYRALAD